MQPRPSARERTRRKALIGAGLWLVAAAGVAWASRSRAQELVAPAARIGRWALAPARTLEVELPGHLAVGDPVLDDSPERRLLGRVARIRDPKELARVVTATWTGPEATWGQRWKVTLAFDPEAAPPARPVAATRWAAADGRWVLETLITEPKRKMIADELQAFLDENRAEVEALVRPIAEDVIGHAMGLLEQNMAAALEKRNKEIHELVDAHRLMIKDELLPVLKKKLGPSARVKAEPLLREIGRELWDALPMWSLGWSAFVDKIPFGQRTRTDQWWADFLENKAIPIVQKHEAELLGALGELIEEGARDPEVRAQLALASRRLANDPKFKALVRGLIEDTIVRPFDGRALVEKLIKDPKHQERLRRLEGKAGPMLQRIGRRLTTDPATGRIDPDLARVLRRVVFGKDGRWVELSPGAP